MISFRRRLHCLPLLFGGIGTGLLLAMIARTIGGAEPAIVILMTGLPFVLAALTGMAKTTTA